MRSSIQINTDIPASAAPANPPRRSWLRTIGTFLVLASAGLARADVEIAPRYADRIPTIDGLIEAGEWSFSAVTVPTYEGELAFYTKNDSNYLYLLIEARADTLETPPGYQLTFDVDLDRAVTDYLDFSYMPGIGPIGSLPLFEKFLFETPVAPGEPIIPHSVPHDPTARAAFGFGITDAIDPGWTKHRFGEFRLPLAELGVPPDSLRSPGSRPPAVRMRLGYSSLDAPFGPVNEPPLSGGKTGFENMYVIRLASAPTHPAGTTGPTFKGIGLVPAHLIDDHYGVANVNEINAPGYLYHTPKDAPFGGTLHVFGWWQPMRTAGATRYRLRYTADGTTFNTVQDSWANFRWTPGATIPALVGFSPDADGAYPIPADAPSNWQLPDLLASWNSAHVPDGTYLLELELLRDGSAVPLPTPAENRLLLKIVNTPPTVRLVRTEYWNGVGATEVCECALVTQGNDLAPRGLQWTVSVHDAAGALDSYQFTGSYGNDRPTDLAVGDAYTYDRGGPRSWTGVDSLVIPSGAPWRAPRSCACTFSLAAHSRVQNGYATLFGTRSNANLTILLGHGAGGTDCGGPAEADAPALSVRRTGDRTIISWPAGFADYRLQFTATPEDPSSWRDWTDPIVTVGAETFAAFPSGSRPAEFYRLRRLP